MEYKNYSNVKIVLQNMPRGKDYAVREGFKHISVYINDPRGLT